MLTSRVGDIERGGDAAIGEVPVVSTFKGIVQIQLKIYAKELHDVYAELRQVRSKLAQYEPTLPEPQPIDHGDQATYEGTVRLAIEVEGSIGVVVRFVHELHEMPELRILRLERDPGGTVTLWISLREPLSLPQVLSRMSGVAEVEQRPDGDPTLVLRLTSAGEHGGSR